jgi:hypothetical protein
MSLQVGDQVKIGGKLKLATVKSVNFSTFHYCYEKFGAIYSMQLNSTEYQTIK